MIKVTQAAILVLVGVVLSGCAAVVTGAPRASEQLSVRETAQRMISSEIATQAGLGKLEPVCEEVAQPVHGFDFRCSASTTDQRIVYFGGQIEPDGKVSVSSSNLLTSANLVELENASISYVNAQLGSAYAASQIECGDASIVLNPERVIGCAFTDPSSRSVFDAEVRIEDVNELAVVVRISNQAR